MNLQRVNVKVFAGASGTVGIDSFLDVFARWREDKHHAAGWVDVADYAHVAKGPGVMLIGRRGNLSIDLADPGPGIQWANKKDLDGSDEDRILETFRRAIPLIMTLVSEPEYPASFPPRPGFWELSLNDRLETPNDDTTDRWLRPSIETAVRRLFGENCTLIREADPQRRYGFAIHSASEVRLDELASRAELAPR